jgi:hypothetical protein
VVVKNILQLHQGESFKSTRWEFGESSICGGKYGEWAGTVQLISETGVFESTSESREIGTTADKIQNVSIY